MDETDQPQPKKARIVLDCATPGKRLPRETSWLVWLGLAIFGFPLLISILHSLLYRPVNSPDKVKCLSQLKSIGTAILTYASDNKGHLPPDFAAIVPQYTGKTVNIFVCPASNDAVAPGATPQQQARNMLSQPGYCSYVYLGAGLTLKGMSRSWFILTYEPVSRHDDGRMNALFADGHVEAIPAAGVPWVISELQSGHNPPRSQYTPQPSTGSSAGARPNERRP
jgi:prepilin-type processing-associated H-X9-DG protein